ncbi:MAG: S8 family serine peptidase [Pseudomonadota bacterium]|nr:S8 family serine peptidase [Pseudomonadota bacterium]
MKFQVRPIAIAAAILLSGAAGLTQAQEVRRAYIVQLQAEPAATYKGDVAGLTATQPAPGAAFDYHSAPVQDYVQYLGAKKSEVLATIAGATVIADYDVVLNGFTAMLTDAEVLSLKANAAVADVQADQARQFDTVTTSNFLGLSKAGGLWSQYAGGSLVKGEDMVVGIVDGGIWPENPAFADRVDADGKPTFDPTGSLAYTSAPVTFKGTCVSGQGFDPAKHCNNKLIGAQFFNAGFLAGNRVLNWSDYVSPRDSNIGTNTVAGVVSTGHGGHGDHTASTAAGNANNPVTMGGAFMGTASGMAPRARVSAYKICWTYNDTTATDGTNATNSCFNSDAVSAIDAAVKDGVNVINYSISGSQTASNDAVELAFYRASLANVFVAASAGNSGPANAVAHISPWLTTVAASTHDRFYVADVTLKTGVKYTGASTNSKALPNTPMIRAEDAGMGGGNASLCYSAGAAAPQVLLDPAKVAGKIVVCTRGTNARTDKSLAVLNAGGAGMILADNGAGLVSEVHSVPTVHVSQADGTAIKAYAQTADAQAAIGVFYNQPKPAPIMASFSSRGPNMGDPNILKPDLTAPGVDIIAHVTPALTAAQHDAVIAGTFVPPSAFDSYQGTSMSSPHVAGVALLLRQAHPSWSPAAIKSALMTTGYNTLTDNLPAPQTGTLPWAQGAGHIDPNKATDPGLVYDAGKADFVQYNCKVNKASVSPASDCTTFGTLDETYNLNLPSITVAAVQGSVTVRRTVTNVGASSATYTATGSVPGFTTVVTPSTLSLAPGASGSFTVKLTNATALANTWNFGSLNWTDGTHNVKIPVTAKIGVPLQVNQAEITSDKLSGSKLFAVKAGYSGTMTYAKGGLKEATLGDTVNLTPRALSSVQLKAICQTGTSVQGVRVYPITVPANTVVLRTALFQEDSNAGDDHDMGLLAPDGTWVYSGNDGTIESAQIASPAAGNYKACVVAYAGNASMKHRLNSWVVTTSDAANKMSVAVPSKVVVGTNTAVAMTWSGLMQNKRYLGAAQFLDAGNVVRATTVLRIETGTASIPAAQVEKTQPSELAAQ